ncbi:MAG: signal peptidase I [Clostridium sp.]|nr:signal peptidase I [Clostridium sp.]
MKILKKVIYTILIIVLGYTVIGNISGTNKTIFNFLHFGNFVVLTGSMEPSISPGDYITVVKTDVNKLEVGDVITYKFNGATVTHKIVEIGNDTVTTQGTANNVADDPIDKSNIVGKYLFKIPKVGYVMSFLSSTAGLILIFGFIGIAIFWEITDPNRGKKENPVSNAVNENSNKYIDDPEYLEYLEFKRRREEKLKENVRPQPKVQETVSKPVMQKAIKQQKHQETVSNQVTQKVAEVKQPVEQVKAKSEASPMKVFEVKRIEKQPYQNKIQEQSVNEEKQEKVVQRIEKVEESSEDAWNVSSTRVKRSARNRR